MSTEYKKEIKEWLWWTHRRQVLHSIRRGHRPPEYTLEQLGDWVKSQPKFFELLDEWIKSNKATPLYPSVDRKDNSIHYCFNNIQLMTWRENNAKQNFEMGKAVTQLDKKGRVINSYKSIRSAARELNICQSAITKVCKGKMNTTGGYRWEYVQ